MTAFDETGRDIDLSPMAKRTLLLAEMKLKRFAIRLDCDGLGVFARSADDWRKLEREIRKPLIVSVLATGGFLLGVIFW